MLTGIALRRARRHDQDVGRSFLVSSSLDPRSFDEAAVRDPDIRALAQRVTMSIVDGQDRRDLACTVTIPLKDGRVLSRRGTECRGTPERPLDQAGLREKFLLLTRHLDRAKMEGLFERLQQIEMEKSLDWLKV